MSVHGGRVAARALRNRGVERIFTFRGLEIQPLYDGCVDERIEVISVRQARTAGHAADGAARLTGRPAVVALGAYAGVTDVVTALATAQHARSPVVCIGGAAVVAKRYRGSPNELDHVELLRPVTKWSASVPNLSCLDELVDAAFRQATHGVPGPVFVEVPLDVLESEVPNEVLNSASTPSVAPAFAPDGVAVELAAKLLDLAERPLLVVGSALAHAHDRDALGRFLAAVPIPVVLDGMARGAIPSDHPCLFKAARDVAISKADVLLFVGRPRVERSALSAGVRVIEVDVEPGSLGIGSAVELAIASHVDLALSALALSARKRSNGPWTEALRELETTRLAGVAAAARSDATPVHRARLFRDLARYLDQRTIVIADGGDIVRAAEQALSVRWPGTWLDAGPLGTLGVGAGFAIAAKLTRPSSKVIVVYGDGAFGMGAIELDTMSRLGLRVVSVIGNDARWSVAWRGDDDSRHGAEREGSVAHTRYDTMVEALGAKGFWVETPEQLGRAFERAFSCDRPALVNVKTARAD